MEIWTIRHGSWWSFEEERVEGEQKNKILNNEIAMQSITGISKWHKESLEAEKMWKQLCEVTYRIRWINDLWNEIHANTSQIEGVISLLWNIILQLQLKCKWMCPIAKMQFLSYFWGIEIGGWVKFHTSCMAARLTSTACVTLSKWARASHSYCMPLNSSDTLHWHHPYYAIMKWVSWMTTG